MASKSAKSPASHTSTLAPPSPAPGPAHSAPYRQMLICLASSRSRSWIRVSKSFRLSRQLKGASKSRSSSTYKPTPPPEDHASALVSSSSSSSSLLPEDKETAVRLLGGLKRARCRAPHLTFTSCHLIIIRFLSRRKVRSADAPVPSVAVDGRGALQPSRAAPTAAGHHRLLLREQPELLPLALRVRGGGWSYIFGGAMGGH